MLKMHMVSCVLKYGIAAGVASVSLASRFMGALGGAPLLFLYVK